MWGHYAGKHQGLCMGFTIPEERAVFVEYVDERFSPPQDLFAKHSVERVKRLLGTKFSHWKYEQEVRLFIGLNKLKPIQGDYFFNFSSQVQLKEIVLGIESQLCRADIENALQSEESDVDIFQARAALAQFEVERDKLQ